MVDRAPELHCVPAMACYEATFTFTLRLYENVKKKGTVRNELHSQGSETEEHHQK